MLWLNFIHLYQPANADEKTIKEAADKSYRYILSVLEKHPANRWTVNITGCLLLRLEEIGCMDVIARFKNLAEKGQIELVGSAAYHPILPLIPKSEAVKQIRENEAILKKYFGDKIKLRGFFFPEMAFDNKTLKIIKKMGYQWAILDEIAASGKLNAIDTGKVYKNEKSGIKIVFRSRQFSMSFVPETISSSILNNNLADNAIITATDGELYGLRHVDNSNSLEKILTDPSISTQTISELIGGSKEQISVRPMPSNWEATEKDLADKNPFVLWCGKNNKIQASLWKLYKLAQKTMDKFPEDSNYEWTRWHLVRGLASCTFWWASGRNFEHVFGPVSWNPDEIERGLNDLVRSIRAINNPESVPAKLKAEKLQAGIRNMVWEEHWTKHAVN
jgi:alpha-amylase/alpha-mannosidase (GH57 family)